MPELPTVIQVCRYLARNRWHREPEGRFGTTVWCSPNGRFVAIPGWDDDDTRLLKQTTVITGIAESAGRTVEQTVADILVDEHDFEDCTLRCHPPGVPESEWRHTHRWGSCIKATPPEKLPAVLHIPRLWLLTDGYIAEGVTAVPLTLFAPWTERLSPAEQWRMLEEVDGSRPESRADVLAMWRLNAEQGGDRG